MMSTSTLKYLTTLGEGYRITARWIYLHVGPGGLGSKPIEFEKGKNAIAVPSFDKIPFVINNLITAVRNGELGDQLAQAKKPATAATSRKAA
jgi:hypothetical protein